MKFHKTIFLLIFLLIFISKLKAQSGELAGNWKADCGREFHPESNAYFVCSICTHLSNGAGLKQFHMNFIKDSLIIPENFTSKKIKYNYTYDQKYKILKFKFDGLDRAFKVIKAGDSFMLVSMGAEPVIILLSREK